MSSNGEEQEIAIDQQNEEMSDEDKSVSPWTRSDGGQIASSNSAWGEEGNQDEIDYQWQEDNPEKSTGLEQANDMQNHQIIFIGNVRTDEEDCYFELKKLLIENVGPVLRLDMKNKYCFVHFENDELACRCLDYLRKIKFKGQTLHIDRSNRHKRWTSKQEFEGSINPSITLFVSNFDHIRTKDLELKEHFERIGPLSDFRFRTQHFNGYCEIDYQKLEDAIRAQK
ncbi:MAG: hypothetical protein EZS28_029778, partial [Streblomastix strix]